MSQLQTSDMVGYRLLQSLYNNTIRDFLPSKYRMLAGVAVHDTPLLDLTADKKSYKQGLMSAIKKGVDPNDEVELIGFGRGVSTVRALDAGATRVTAYEASADMIELGTETVRANRPFDRRVSVEHAIVGDPIRIYGDYDDARVVCPSELCTSDVLILDCEGSEKSVLESLGKLPETIICETHPERGVPVETISQILEDNYELQMYEYEPGIEHKKVILGEVLGSD
ncbi:hypothetical protein ACLI4Q_13170 [Natrialbaceae archaeon A-CW1-1]